jgi:hypothetical protein
MVQVQRNQVLEAVHTFAIAKMDSRVSEPVIPNSIKFKLYRKDNIVEKQGNVHVRQIF